MQGHTKKHHIDELVNVTPALPALARFLAIHLCHQHSGAKLKEIGSYFGLSILVFPRRALRLSAQLEKNQEWREKVRSILSDLGRGNV